MKCPKCGKKVPQNQKYCFYCGTKVSTENQSSTGNEAQFAAGNEAQFSSGNEAQFTAGNEAQFTAGNEAQFAAGNDAPFTAGSEFQFTAGNAPGTPQNNKNKTLVKILLTVLLATLLIAFIAYWFSRKGAPAASSSTEPVSTQSEDAPEEPQDNPQDGEPETPSADSQSSLSVQSEIEYSVMCVSADTGKTLQKSVYTGKIGEDITLDAPVLPGLISKQDELTITLTENASENIMLFMYYEENSEDSYEDADIPEDNVFYFNGHTYLAVRTSSITSFWEASSYCMSRGGYLASINSDAENRALYDYVFDDCGLESAYFGFTDDGSEGYWYWSNGDPVTYTNWLVKQPDNLNGRENYALFYYDDTPYKWNDGDFGLDARGTVTFLIEWDTQ